MKFKPGQIYVTRGVHALMTNNDEFANRVQQSLTRHLTGDWGELCAEDRTVNEVALLEGYRLFSAYKKEGEPTIWVITECDRSATTVLFPDEY